jgi:hypothetical protein
MFNPVTPAQLVLALGRAARDAATGGEMLSEFDRTQLFTAYTAARHLSAEIEGYEPEIRCFGHDVAALIRPVLPQLRSRKPMADLLSKMEGVSDPRTAGDLTSAMLELLREDASEAAPALRRKIQSRLRELSEREIEILAGILDER